MGRNVFAVATLGLAALGGGLARAQAPATSAADEAARLFYEGNDLRTEGRFTEACDRFARSYVLDHTAGAELSLADCAERVNQLGRAWELYDAAARAFESTGNVASAKYAREQAAKLAPRLATLVVHLAEPDRPGLAVKIGGRAVPPAGTITRLDDARAFDVDVTAPGAKPFHQSATGTAGAQVTIDVPALAAEGERGPGPAPVHADDDHPYRRRSRTILAASVGGAGVLALGTSLGVALWARNDYSSALHAAGCMDTHCPAGANVRDAYDTQQDRMKTADVLAVAGGVAVAAGIVLFVTAPRETLVVAPTASSTGAGLSLSGSF